jgi:uncharacterized protein
MTGEGGQERPALDEDTIAFAGRMFQAARAGDPELERMLAAGLPPNLRNDKGDTLLMLAAYHGHASLVRALMEAGADPEVANDRGQLPLSGVAFKGDLAAARELLEHGASVDGAGPDGRTALATAAMFDRVEMMELLLQYGADPERADANGATPLSLAQAMGAAAAVARLSSLDDETEAQPS